MPNLWPTDQSVLIDRLLLIACCFKLFRFVVVSTSQLWLLNCSNGLGFHWKLSSHDANGSKSFEFKMFVKQSTWFDEADDVTAI